MSPIPSHARGLEAAEPLSNELARLESALGELETFRQSGAVAYRPHPLLLLVARRGFQVVVAHARVWQRLRSLFAPYKDSLALRRTSLCLIDDGSFDEKSLQQNSAVLSGVLSTQPSALEAFVATERAIQLIEASSHAESRGTTVARYESEMGELIDIARAMTTERDVDTLLGLILQKSRLVTNADAGSIYVLETQERGGTLLRFKLTQNDSVRFDSREFTMPISTRSIAGAVALDKKAINIADVYQLPATSPFGFDRSFDQRVGYVTRSMLTVPLISQQDEVIGVIQLINKKRSPQALLTSRDDVAREVVAFDMQSEKLVGMVAAQAGVSLENALLYAEISNLFASFVTASVDAIESRDPTTSGHSRRVANLTVELAKVVDQNSHGVYADARFSRDDLREIEYASLLHDFGKIGVREKVLVKAKKLYDDRLELLQARFEYVGKALEAELLERKLHLLQNGGSKDDLDRLDDELRMRRAQLHASYESVLHANEPTVMAAGDFARIEELAHETYIDGNGAVQRLLDDQDVVALSVKRGTLTASEYEEITSHVSHTYRFLAQIPWGKKLRHVPAIAGAHHERINGTGYPNRLQASEIPVQSKMMSIADIFDALTASDRPYKRAVPVERALDILDFNVKDGHVDGELVRIFKEAHVWDRAWGDSPPPASLRK